MFEWKQEPILTEKLVSKIANIRFQPHKEKEETFLQIHPSV